MVEVHASHTIANQCFDFSIIYQRVSFHGCIHGYFSSCKLLDRHSDFNIFPSHDLQHTQTQYQVTTFPLNTVHSVRIESTSASLRSVFTVLQKTTNQNDHHMHVKRPMSFY